MPPTFWILTTVHALFFFHALNHTWCCQFPIFNNNFQFNTVQSLSHVRLFATPWTTAGQASLSITNSRSLPNSCPLSRWCHPTTSFSVVPFSSSFNLSQHQGLFKWELFVSGGQSVGVSASEALVRYNYFTFHEVHTLICTSQCFLVYSYSSISITTAKFQDISITSERNPTPARGHVLPEAPGSHWFLSVSMDLPPRSRHVSGVSPQRAAVSGPVLLARFCCGVRQANSIPLCGLTTLVYLLASWWMLEIFNVIGIQLLINSQHLSVFSGSLALVLNSFLVYVCLLLIFPISLPQKVCVF